MAAGKTPRLRDRLVRLEARLRPKARALIVIRGYDEAGEQCVLAVVGGDEPGDPTDGRRTDGRRCDRQ